MRRLLTLLTVAATLLIGCFSEQEPPVAPEAPPELYSVSFSTNTAAEVEVYTLTSGALVFRDSTPCFWQPVARQKVLYRFLAEGYQTVTGALEAIPGQQSEITRDLMPTTPQPAPTWAELTGPDSVDAGTSANYTLASNGQYAVVYGVGQVSPNGSFSYHFRSGYDRENIIATVYGEERWPRVVQKVVYVRNIVEPPPAGSIDIAGPSGTIGANQRFNITLTSANCATGTGFIAGAELYTGPAPVNGSYTLSIALSATSTITYYATGLNGELVQDTVRVPVQGTPPPPSPIVTLTANPSSIVLGDSIVLFTNAQHADYVVISSGITPTVYLRPARDTVTVWPQQSGVIRARAFGRGGTAEDQVAITVTVPAQPPATPTLVAPVNGASGQSLELTLVWNPSLRAATYRLQVATSPTFSTTVVDRPNLAGITSVVNGLSYATTYYWRVNASNTVGTSAWSDVWSFRTRSAPGTPFVDIWANPDTVTAGDSATVTWTSHDVTRTFIPQFGQVEPQGYRRVAPTVTTTYALYGEVNGTVVVRDSATIVVLDEPPPIEFKLWVSPSVITRGDSSKLNWTSRYADSILIDGIGRVAASGWRWVKPTVTTTYLGHAWRSGLVQITREALLTVNQPSPVTLGVTAQPSSIVRGDSSLLVWFSSNADSVTADDFGRVSLNGTRWVQPQNTRTYVFHAWRYGAVAAIDSATVNVAPPAPVSFELFLDHKYVTVSQWCKQLTHSGNNQLFTMPPHEGMVRVDVQVEYSGNDSGQTYEAFILGAYTGGGDTSYVKELGSTCPVVPDNATLTGERWRTVGYVNVGSSFKLTMLHGVTNTCDGIGFGNVPPGHHSVHVGLQPEITQGKIRFTYFPAP